jgi:glycerol-3-phosphate dehydrogenase
MPITQTVYAVLQGETSPKKALKALMERPQRDE